MMRRAVTVVIAIVFPQAIAGAQYGSANDQRSARVVASAGPLSVVQRILGERRHPAMRWPDIRDVAPMMQRLYEERGWTPLWFRDDVATPLTASLIRVLARADARGLRPSDYDATMLTARVTEVRRKPGTLSNAEAASLDAAITANALRFAHALRYGRVHPTMVHAALRLPQDTADLAGFVRQLAASVPPIDVRDTVKFDAWTSARFDTLEPPWVHYRRLRQALQQYQAFRTDTLHRPAELTTAKLTARIRRIELSLERWRWLPHAFPAPSIFINIPAFRLYAFASPRNDDTSTVLGMDVVVGKAYKTRTPVFSAMLQTVIFSPYWDVPPSIARKELLPKARRNIDYLARQHMEIVSTASARVLPLTYGSLEQVPSGGARIRQRPGPDNALGGVKFVFPNDYNVYLHDTPVQSAFALARRDVSHGCIRVAEPARLAAFVLRDQPTWTAGRIDSAMHGTQPLTVPVVTPIPVFIVYTTALVRATGQVVFYDDIYGLDRKLANLLAQGYPYE